MTLKHFVLLFEYNRNDALGKSTATKWFTKFINYSDLEDLLRFRRKVTENKNSNTMTIFGLTQAWNLVTTCAYQKQETQKIPSERDHEQHDLV